MRPLAVSRKRIKKSDISRELEELTSNIRKFISPLAIYLFGSAAEDEMYEDSDIDILMIFKDSSSLRDAQKFLKDAYPLCSRSVDIVWMTKVDFDQKKKVGGVAFTANDLNQQI